MKKIKHLEVLGVQVKVEWGEFLVGSSFFVPCLDDRLLAASIRARAKQQGFQTQYQARVENGMWGVRIWRVA
jgi:hypothetical protein